MRPFPNQLKYIHVESSQNSTLVKTYKDDAQNRNEVHRHSSQLYLQFNLRPVHIKLLE